MPSHSKTKPIRIRSHVEELKNLLIHATELREELSCGRYSDEDYKVLEQIIKETTSHLPVSKSAIAKSAGLSSGYFSARHYKPQLDTILKGLTAVINTISASLDKMDAELPDPDQIRGWQLNPVKTNPEVGLEIQEGLARIIDLIKTSNSLSQHHELNVIYKQSIIETLETILELLKAPLIEKSIIRKGANKLKRLATKTAQDGATSFVTTLANNMAKKLLELL